LNDPIAGVRTAAVEAAFSSGGSRAVPALVGALRDTHWEVRLGSATALGTLRDHSVVDNLCELIQDPDRDVRERAIKSLEKINDRRAIPTLVTALLDMESVVRHAATAALERIDLRWHEDKTALEFLPQIQRGLQHPDYWVRYCAGQLLEKLGVDVKSLVKDAPKVAPAVAKETPVHPAFPILADLLFDRDRGFRLGAAEALGRLREKKAKSLLAECSNDSDDLVRQAVKTALAALN
jgi:HEAT repeat protein